MSKLPRLLLQGIDSLYVSYFFDPSTSLIDWDTLFFKQQQLKQSKRRDGEEFQLGNTAFLLHRGGRNRYSFVLSNRDFTICLSEGMSPCCYVQFMSEGLWAHGAQALLAKFDAWAASVGLIATRLPKVARVDWAFDFAIDTIDFDEDHFVSRAEKDSQHRASRALQNFSFGKNDVVVRVYDKVAEITEESGKTWFFDMWERDKGVWRIEFQVRGEALKLRGIQTPDDVFDHQGDILTYLAHEQTTLRVPSGDSNRSRWPLHSVWKALHVAIAEMPRLGLIKSFDPRSSDRLRLHQIAKSTYGLLKGFGALTASTRNAPTPPTLEETMSCLNQYLASIHQADLFRADVEDRMVRHRLGDW